MNIEEIKKEIENIDITVEMMKDISKYDEAIFKILDKHKESPRPKNEWFEKCMEARKFQNAWIEFKELCLEYQILELLIILKNLEQKHGIEVE